MDRPQVGVAVIIASDGRVLLLKRKGAHGEECAMRETLEETEIAIRDVHFVANTNDVFAAEQKHYVTVWMEGTRASGEATVAYPDKVEEVVWVPWNALPQPLFLPFQNLLSGKHYPGAIHVGDQPST